MEQNKVQISFRVGEQLKRKFYSKLELDGVDMVDFFTQAMESYTSDPLKSVAKAAGSNQRWHDMLALILGKAKPKVAALIRDSLKVHSSGLGSGEK